MAHQEYYVVHDYGMGGIWAIVAAPSKVAVESSYPELRVFAQRPSWMDDREYREIKAGNSFPFDDPPEYWRRWYSPG